MGIAAILFSGAESYEKSVNTPSSEGPMRNLVKVDEIVSETIFKDLMISYM